jgi:hypothetical protein
MVMNLDLQHSNQLTRRRFLKAGTLGSMGFGLAELMRMRALAGESQAVNHDSAVILVWLPGGLSHMDTYDMKPGAPPEYRGDFRPVSTAVSGINVCELLPLHAKMANRFTLIRSVSHTFGEHGGAHKRVLTGRIPKRDGPTGTPNDTPSVGCIVGKMREHALPDVLPFTSGQYRGAGADSFSQGAAYLGQSYEPFIVPGDPSDEEWSIPNLAVLPELSSRLTDRRTLLYQFDRLQKSLDQRGTIEACDRFQQKAFSLLTSDASRRAFDLSQEDPALRERYGRNPYGQQALLARRLVEAGTSFATVVMEHPGGNTPQDGVYNWDCHAVDCHIFQDARWRLPIFDQAVSALIEDVYARGLDRKVMIVVTGEFGHTPRISYKKGTKTGVLQPGRDHWPGAMSLLVSGGGLRMGQVIGSTNSRGEYPQERPLSPDDVWATVYHHLRIDPKHSFLDHSGRPMPILPDGEPIRELL